MFIYHIVFSLLMFLLQLFMLYLLYFRKSSNKKTDQKQNKVIPTSEQTHAQLHRSQSIEQTLKKSYRRQINRHGTQSVETFNESAQKSQQQSLKTSSQIFSSRYYNHQTQFQCSSNQQFSLKREIIINTFNARTPINCKSLRYQFINQDRIG